jgi:hypothetical protein
LNKLQELNSHSIIFLNIPSYAGGRKPWKNGEDGYERQSYFDGNLEIVGFHTAGFVSSFSLSFLRKRPSRFVCEVEIKRNF